MNEELISRGPNSDLSPTSFSYISPDVGLIGSFFPLIFSFSFAHLFSFIHIYIYTIYNDNNNKKNIIPIPVYVIFKNHNLMSIPTSDESFHSKINVSIYILSLCYWLRLNRILCFGINFFFFLFLSYIAGRGGYYVATDFGFFRKLLSC